MGTDEWGTMEKEEECRLQQRTESHMSTKRKMDFTGVEVRKVKGDVSE